MKPGDEVEVKVLRVDVPERKIGLSRKRLDQPGLIEGEGDDVPDMPLDAPALPVKPTGKQKELRGGTGGGGNLINLPGQE